MSADRTQSALLRQVTPSLHVLTASTPDNVLSDQPHLVTSRPAGTSCSVSSRQTECPRESGVQAEGRRLLIILHQNLQSKSLQPIYLSRNVFSLNP
jgi:hypothetical protein